MTLAGVLLLVSPLTYGAATTNAAASVIAFLERRMQKDPDDFIAAAKLGRTYLQESRESGRIDRFKRAEALFRLALKTAPESCSLRAALSPALLSQHRFEEAAECAGEAAKACPDDPAANAAWGDALLELGDISAAESIYMRLTTETAGSAAFARLAKIAWLRGNPEAAISNLTALLEFPSLSAETLAWTHVSRGELYFRTGSFTNAEKDYRAALAELPGYFLAVDHLAELSAARGGYEDAAIIFQRLAKETNRPEYLHAAGDVYAAAKKPSEAKIWHDRALAVFLKETESGSVQYHHHLAAFYSDVLQDGTAAEKWARRDLEVRHTIYAWDALAWALFWKKSYVEAADAMDKALRLGTRDAHLLSHAALIYARAEQIAKARHCAKAMTAANPRADSFHLHR